MSQAGQPTTLPLWRNVSFMLMWSSVAASGFGDRIVQLAAWQLCGINVPQNEPAQITASITFFFMLPYVLFGPVAGWIADTLPRKWIMLCCDETRALVLMVAFVVAPVGAAAVIPGDEFWKVYAVVFATGTLAAIFSPTKAAVMPQIVPIRQLQSANAIVLGIAVIASMIGLGLGDRIIAQQSVRGGLFWAVLCFAISGTFFAFLKVRRHHGKALGTRPGQIQRLVQAVGYIRRHRAIILLIGQSIAFWASAHLFLNAIGTLCVQLYGVAPEQLRSQIAIMSMLVGLGMLCSALWVAWMRIRRESTWIALGGLFMSGVMMMALSVNQHDILGLALGFATGFFGNTAMICVATLTQSITPNYIRGRVFGVRDVVITITAVLVNLLIWRVPGSNEWMIPTLQVAACTLGAITLFALLVELSGGPMPSRSANAFWRCERWFVLVWHRLRWVGRENVPRSGPVILASNHTSALDPFLMQAAVPRMVRWVMLTAFMFWWVKPLWRAIKPITLDRDGSDLSKLRKILNVLKDGQIIGLFPEGHVQGAHRELQPFEQGIGMIARRSGAMIVPCWIAGTPQTKSLLLQIIKPTQSTIIFGKPYQVDAKASLEKITEDLRARIIELSKLVA